MVRKDHKYKTAIKKTLIYSSIFKYPLTYYQLLNYLIIDPQKKINIKTFDYELSKLINKKYIKVDDEKCYLPGIKYVDWKKKKKISKVLIRQNKYAINILGKIPWVNFIGITGSIAAYNADKDADIDILVITQTNRLWITRGLFTLILKLILKNYVHKGIDPNIFLDETNLEWEKDKQNLYTANEIVRMQPIVNKNDTYFKFMQANKWIKSYMGNYPSYNYEEKKNKSDKKEKIQGEFLFNFLDSLAMYLQIKYMHNKKTKEVTTKHLIHFNKNDSTNPILKKYSEKIENI